MYPYQVTRGRCHFCGRDAEQVIEAFGGGRYYRVCASCVTACRHAFAQQEATAAEASARSAGSAPRLSEGMPGAACHDKASGPS
jgi:hypothetical protein